MISGDPEDLFPERTKEQEDELDAVLSALFKLKIIREQDELEIEISSTVGSGDQ